MLNKSDQSRIGFLLSHMGRCSLNRPLLYKVMLFGLMDACEIKGPCSIIRVSGFDSRKTYIVGKPSTVNVNYMENLALKPLWFKYIKGDRNPILNGIHLKYTQTKNLVDFADGTEILEKVKYYENTDLWNRLFGVLAKGSNIKGLGYLWLTFSSGFTWVICLRKRKDEGLFNQKQRDFLLQFGHTALGNQGNWYMPTFDVLDSSNIKQKDKLSDRQFETLYHLGRHCSRKECAKLMGVGDTTIDRNVETLLRVFRDHSEAFRGKNISQIIRILKESAIGDTQEN